MHRPQNQPTAARSQNLSRQPTVGPKALATESTPATAQLTQYQRLADGSAQVAQLQQYQALADGAVLQKQSNYTGIPDSLKAGVEGLSGHSLDDVKVHYHSSKPAQLQAHAYAQGTDIHLATGQEHHLPHEAWHVVQQKQGRVAPTMQAKGVAINDDSALEKEADTMGAKAMQMKPLAGIGPKPVQRMSYSSAVVQREVFRSRRTGRHYTDLDESKTFETREQAKAYEDELIIARETAKREQQQQAKEARYAARRQELLTKYPGYTPPPSDEAHLYKNDDKDRDDVSLTTLNPDNAKSFMNRALEERRAGMFGTQMINLGGFHHVLAPGTDIGLTPALNRPDLQTDTKIPAFSREGQPKTYDSLSKSLDQIATKYANANSISLKEARIRMGKDLDRMTRGSKVAQDFPYTQDELRTMNEVAAVLRLDKGRVPKATHYIRQTMTAGDYSFRQLLFDNYYVGAGSGGVDALRRQMTDDGEESEGSDIEERGIKRKANRGLPDNGPRKRSMHDNPSDQASDDSDSQEPGIIKKVKPNQALVMQGPQPPPQVSENRVGTEALQNYLNHLAPNWDVNQQQNVGNQALGQENQGIMAHEAQANNPQDFMPQFNPFAEPGQLQAHQLRVLHSGGTSALCFIYAIIMGLTGQAEGDIHAIVQWVAQRAGVPPQGFIAMGSQVANNVIGELHGLYGQFQVVEVMPGQNGNIISGRSHQAGSELRPVVIRNTGGHYDAYAP